MAKQEKENQTKNITPDTEAPSGTAKESSVEKDIDNDIYNLPQGDAGSELESLYISHSRCPKFNIIQITAAICVLLVIAGVIKVLLSISAGEKPVGTVEQAVVPVPAEPAAVQTQTQTAEQTPVKAEPPSAAVQPPAPAVEPEPLSLHLAYQYYNQQDYSNAYSTYAALKDRLESNTSDELMEEFLTLRMALCMYKADDLEQAGSLFESIAAAKSPVVCITANYYLCFVRMKQKQFLKARTHAYQALALIDAVDSQTDWAAQMRGDMAYAAGQAITRQVIAMGDSDKDIPPELWLVHGKADPFTFTDTKKLDEFLADGRKKLNRGLLGAEIEKISTDASTARWSASGISVPFEEFISRYASAAGCDVKWFPDCNSDVKTTDSMKRRAITAFIASAEGSDLARILAGCAGFFAATNPNGNIVIKNSIGYKSLSDYTAMLTEEAMSIWRSFVLAYHSDPRQAYAYFSTAVLEAQQNNMTEALAQFRIVVNRYGDSPVAPYALLHSGKLKQSVKNYLGARDDLQLLVEQYPDCPMVDQTYIYLAHTAANLKIYDEALRLYSKVFNLGLSEQSHTDAAYGASQCCFELGEYEETVKWVNRFLSFCDEPAGAKACSAYLLMGKALVKLGKMNDGTAAFKKAISGDLNRDDYADTVINLIRTGIEQQDYVSALDEIEGVRHWLLNRNEAVEVVLLKSRALRLMGLVDKAISNIGDRVDYIDDEQLKAQMLFELVNCYTALKEYENAEKTLIRILTIVKPGPFAHQAALRLAEVLVELKSDQKAVKVCLELAALEPQQDIKGKALELLAIVYERNGQYDKAASVLTENLHRTNDGSGSPSDRKITSAEKEKT